MLIDAERDREKQYAAWPEDSAEFLRRSGPVAGPTLPMRGVGGKASVVAADVFQCRQAEHCVEVRISEGNVAQIAKEVADTASSVAILLWRQCQDVQFPTTKRRGLHDVPVVQR